MNRYRIWLSGFGYFANEGAKYPTALAALEAGKEHGFSFVVIGEEEQQEFAKTIACSWDPLSGPTWYITEAE